jgi:hypothetical protein
MADQRGGYRRPNNPAQVSGPGALSQRTDGKPGETMKQAQRYISGMPYGEAGELNAVAGSAPLAAGIRPEDVQRVSFDAPTMEPDFTIGSRPLEPTQANPIEPAIQAEPKSVGDPVAEYLRAAYIAFPSPALKAAIEKLAREGR